MVELDGLEDEERTCEVCGAEACFFELQSWQWIGEGESAANDIWWLCPQHSKAITKNIGDYIGYLTIQKIKREGKEDDDEKLR